MADHDSPLTVAFWQEHLEREVLRFWLRHAPDGEYGGYVADFDRQWRPSGPGCKSLVSQARLIYNFSAGYRLFGRDEYLRAADLGLAFLLERMVDGHNGGWYWRCNRDGTLLESIKHTYGHAFVIFGLAECARATGRADLVTLAWQTYDILRHRAVGPNGWFWSIMTADWQPAERRRGQNPHMHMLEALLSLYVAGTDRRVLQAAIDLARFAAERFVHPEYGCLEEYFHEDWGRLDDSQAAAVQVGHQFEWCWLLNRLCDLAGTDEFRDLAGHLADWALEYGFDRTHGGFFNACDRRGAVVDSNKTFWVQTEALRALLYLLLARGRDDVKPALEQSLRFVLGACVDSEFGGWFNTVSAEGRPVRPDKGSEWKLDYHVVSLCDEAIRLLSGPTA